MAGRQDQHADQHATLGIAKVTIPDFLTFERAHYAARTECTGNQVQPLLPPVPGPSSSRSWVPPTLPA
jgi:hypothetical protein